jgi:hypothetical protein
VFSAEVTPTYPSVLDITWSTGSNFNMNSRCPARHKTATSEQIRRDRHCFPQIVKISVKDIRVQFYKHLTHLCTRWRSWWRHYATSRKVASSNPDGATEILHCLNRPGRTKNIGSTQLLREMCTRNISRVGKGGGGGGSRLLPCHLQVPIV